MYPACDMKTFICAVSVLLSRSFNKVQSSHTCSYVGAHIMWHNFYNASLLLALYVCRIVPRAVKIVTLYTLLLFIRYTNPLQFISFIYAVTLFLNIIFAAMCSLLFKPIGF